MGAIFAKETVTRANMASWLYSKLTAAGWTMVSSNIPSNHYVFRSAGEEGDRRYFIVIDFDKYSAGTSELAEVYMCLDYTPGTAGASGTFVKFGSPGYMWMPSTVVLPVSASMDVYYSINKDRAIICCVTPMGLASVISGKTSASCLLYMGQPRADTRVSYYPFGNNNYVHVLLPGRANYFIPFTAFYYPPSSDRPDAWSAFSGTEPVLLNNFYYKPGMGKAVMVPVRIQYAGVDYGTLEDVYILPSTHEYLDGDTMDVNGQKYRVCITADGYYNNHPWLALRVQ